MIDFFFLNIISLNLGFILDLIFGDPNYTWHPIILLGKLNNMLEKKLYSNRKTNGLLLVIISISITVMVMLIILIGSLLISPLIYLIISTILSYQIFATRSLFNASKLVYEKLKDNDLIEARIAVSMIVGRNTETLSQEQVINACIESVAENTSDGISAPMFYLALGGPLFGMIYKDINTLDSMIGYNNTKYSKFGFFAAKIDDLFNLIPARLTAYAMILASVILRYDYKNALKVYLRDKYNHLSPNAGHLEAASAGALNIQLGGTHTYNDKIVVKPTIGDKKRQSDLNDISKINKLMIMSSIICLISCNLIYLLLRR